MTFLKKLHLFVYKTNTIGVNEDVRKRVPSELSAAIKVDAAMQLLVTRPSDERECACYLSVKLRRIAID